VRLRLDRQTDAANRLDWKGECSGNPHAMAALILVWTWTHEGSERTHGVSPDRGLTATISNLSLGFTKPTRFSTFWGSPSAPATEMAKVGFAAPANG